MFKKTLAAVAVLGAFAGSAFAANVTMYGVVDTGLGYTSIDKGYGEDVNVRHALRPELRCSPRPEG